LKGPHHDDLRHPHRPRRARRLCDLIEDLDARLGGRYDPALDDLEREAAELCWQLGHA
jgi:hypothetical protein